MLKKLLWTDKVHTCPWWLAYSFDNPVRPILHNPYRLLGDLIQPGDRVADIGCGMGHFTLGMARLVGPQGKVAAIDLQEQMLARTGKRAARVHLAERIELYHGTPDGYEAEQAFDFVLTFWMLHEVREPATFLEAIYDRLKDGGRYLTAEPKGHVSQAVFEREVELAKQVGFKAIEPRKVAISRAMLFEK